MPAQNLGKDAYLILELFRRCASCYLCKNPGCLVDDGAEVAHLLVAEVAPGSEPQLEIVEVLVSYGECLVNILVGDAPPVLQLQGAVPVVGPVLLVVPEVPELLRGEVHEVTEVPLPSGKDRSTEAP